MKLWYALHYWIGLFFFGVAIGLLQLLGLLGLFLPTGPHLRRFAQSVIRRYLQVYFVYLKTVGVFRTTFPGWKKAFSSEPGIILSNHPSMLDAPLFLSRLPRGVCIFKAALGRNVMRGRTAAVTGYMHSEGGVDGLREIITAVRAGSQFIFFPEGTRTSKRGEIKLKSFYAVVAKYAQVPVHVFAIERDTNGLCKDHRLGRCPIIPGTFQVRHVTSISPEAFATAAQLHEALARVLLPIIEAHRSPVDHRCYARREIIEEGPDRVEWRLHLPEGAGFFAGHFPGHPIAPGALSVHWMQEAWAAGPGKGVRRVPLERARFEREMLPGDTIHLVLEHRKGRWQVELRAAAGTVARATISGEGGHGSL